MRREPFKEGYPGRLVETGSGVLAFVPDPLPPRAIPVDMALLKANGAAHAALGALQMAFPPEDYDPFLMVHPLLGREAVCSSRMEGTFTTPRELALFDIGGGVEPKVRGRVDAETREVVNYIRAVRKGLSLIREENLPVCHRLIRAAHAVLMEGVRGSTSRPGEYRRDQNYIGRRVDGIGGARFVPPPPGEVPAAMDRLEAFINTEATRAGSIDLLVAFALIHYQFETIHPFEDGNGRIGRMLIPLLMVEKGLLKEPLLHLSPVLEKRKEEYVERMLAVSREGDWRGWLLFFLEVVEKAAGETVAKAASLRRLRAAYDEKVLTRRSSALLPRLLDEVFRRNSITIKDAATILRVTEPQAAAHIHRLEALQILEEMTGNAKYQRFACPDIMGIIFE
ncbi:MAG: Fic family protein [Planctomycetaceae bacterium]|nr:Fic family protein [Planctomycetaceae bacterium]